MWVVGECASENLVSEQILGNDFNVNNFLINTELLL